MKALVIEKVNELMMYEKNVPVLKSEDDVIVRVTLTGICGTDIRMLKGLHRHKFGTILGHEGVGVVEKAGSNVKNLQVGDRVFVDPTMNCGTCYYCKKGLHNLCDNLEGTEVGVDMDGTFTEFIRMPKDFVYKIPDSMSNEAAVMVEPLACVLNNVKLCNLNADDVVIVLGSGPIGALFGMVSERTARKTVVVDNDERRLRFLRKHYKRVVDARNDNWKEEVFKMTDGEKPTVVLEANGKSCDDAIDIVGKGGRVVLMGYDSSNYSTINTSTIIAKAIKILGGSDYSDMFFQAIEVGQNYDLAKFVTHKFKLDDFKEAFEMILEQDIDTECELMKVAFEF